MYIELEKEMAEFLARRDRGQPLSQEDRDFVAKFERHRYASSHRPHGCNVLPCAMCRGARVPYERAEQ